MLDLNGQGCGTCRGVGHTAPWFSFAAATAPDGEVYLAAIECPACHGTGGWEGQVQRRLTLNDLRAMIRRVGAPERQS